MKNVDQLKQKIEKKFFMRKLIVYTVNLCLNFKDERIARCFENYGKLQRKFLIVVEKISKSIFLEVITWHITAICESSHRRCSIKKAVFKNFTLFIRKHLCWSLFLIKLQAWMPLLKKDSNGGVFLWILRNF